MEGGGSMDDLKIACTLIGEHAHNIDKKGRIIIPVTFREVYNNELIVSKGLDGCLTIYTIPQWQVLMEQVSKLPNTKKETRLYKRNLASKASRCELDVQGRILIPASLVAVAGLEKECFIVGTGSTVEIWSKENWLAYNDEHSDDFETVAETLTEFLI